MCRHIIGILSFIFPHRYALYLISESATAVYFIWILTFVRNRKRMYVLCTRALLFNIVMVNFERISQNSNKTKYQLSSSLAFKERTREILQLVPHGMKSMLRDSFINIICLTV